MTSQHNMIVVPPINRSHILTGTPPWNNDGCKMTPHETLRVINPVSKKQHPWHGPKQVGKQAGPTLNTIDHTPILSRVFKHIDRSSSCSIFSCNVFSIDVVYPFISMRTFSQGLWHIMDNWFVRGHVCELCCAGMLDAFVVLFAPNCVAPCFTLFT